MLGGVIRARSISLLSLSLTARFWGCGTPREVPPVVEGVVLVSRSGEVARADPLARVRRRGDARAVRARRARRRRVHGASSCRGEVSRRAGARFRAPRRPVHSVGGRDRPRAYASASALVSLSLSLSVSLSLRGFRVCSFGASRGCGPPLLGTAR